MPVGYSKGQFALSIKKIIDDQDGFVGWNCFEARITILLCAGVQTVYTFQVRTMKLPLCMSEQ